MGYTTTTTPRSGWLNKLSTSNAFGTSRWQSRYFVLLDSEMRYYKDEHSATASRTINLRDIAKVIPTTSSSNRPYCFRLEPTLYYQSQHSSATRKSQRKMWIMECQSDYELEAWVSAINLRLSKLCFDEEDHQLNEIISPTLQPFSTPEQKRRPPSTSLFRAMTSASTISNTSSLSSTSTASGSLIELEPSSTKPTVFVSPQPRPLKRSNPSISRRRGVFLSPLDMPGLDSSNSSSSTEEEMLSSSSSKGSSLPSPTKTAANNRPIIEELDEEDETIMMAGHHQQADKITAHPAYVLDASSPTFALYKERFHL